MRYSKCLIDRQRKVPAGFCRLLLVLEGVAANSAQELPCSRTIDALPDGCEPIALDDRSRSHEQGTGVIHQEVDNLVAAQQEDVAQLGEPPKGVM